MNENTKILVPTDKSFRTKDKRYRLIKYADRCTLNNRPWYSPELDEYLKYLIEECHLSKGSAATHIGTIRMRYEFLLEDESTLRILREIALKQPDPETFLFQALEQMKKATSKDAGRVEYKRQPQISHLTSHQLRTLHEQPNIQTRQGLRDRLAMGLIFCTGMTEAELCALKVSDFHFDEVGSLWVHIPSIQDGVERIVPIYDFKLFGHNWVKSYLVTWLDSCQIRSGLIMRGFFRGGMKMNAKTVTSQGIQKVLASYPVEGQAGEKKKVTCLDLRRTFARCLFLSNVDFEVIQEQLGHRQSATTLEYIGLPNVSPDKSQEPLNFAEALLDELSNYWPRSGSLSLDDFFEEGNL
jgi:site-specific recombinase XerD